MPSKKGQVMASPSVKLLSPTGLVALLALKAPPQLDEGGRGGPHQGDWARKDGSGNQCDDQVGRASVLSGNDPQQ
jgi:hypothetical protein